MGWHARLGGEHREVLGIGRQHQHRSRLLQRRRGHDCIDGVAVAVEPGLVEERRGALGDVLGHRDDPDMGYSPCQRFAPWTIGPPHLHQRKRGCNHHRTTKPCGFDPAHHVAIPVGEKREPL